MTSCQFYWDKDGQLVRNKDISQLKQHAIKLSLYNSTICFHRGVVKLDHLSTVSLTFARWTREQILHTIRGLFVFVPSLERLSVAFQKGAYEDFHQEDLNRALAPMEQSSVKHLVFNTGYSYHNFQPSYGWHGNLTSLSIDCRGWNLNQAPLLTSLRATGDDYLFQTQTLTLLECTVTQSWSSVERACNVLYYLTEGQAKFLHLHIAYLRLIDNEAAAEKNPTNLGMYFGYKILRRRLANLVLMNRHVHRTFLKRILLQAAKRAHPYLADSILDISSLVFRLLRLT
jgi:hypothetical protein